MGVEAIPFSRHMMRALTLCMTAGVTVFSTTALAETRGPPPKASAAQWNAYWNQGKAELTSYDLTQARYGALHGGRAVLVFVTEPFSRKKQVKLDYPRRAGSDAVEVLKLNHTRKFNTGIYPYSTMRSVFTPTNGDSTLKVTMSMQEWCGHVFMQLNRQPKGYKGTAFSYFESEGDTQFDVPSGVLLEDDVWTTARIDPAKLPTGQITMLPSTTYLRLLHVPVGPRPAEARLAPTQDGWQYTVRYPGLKRTLTIDLERAFPYRIVRWAEAIESGFGLGRQPLTTVAKRKATIQSAYWQQNGPQDRGLRKQLGLPEDF